MIFSQIWAEPWYGKNSGLMQGLTTGPYPIELDWEQPSVCTTADSGTMHTLPRSTCVDKP